MWMFNHNPIDWLIVLHGSIPCRRCHITESLLTYCVIAMEIIYILYEATILSVHVTSICHIHHLNQVRTTDKITTKFRAYFMGLSLIPCHCPACRTTLVATRFRVAVICPIIQVPHCIRVFFYFVWFVFINHIFQFYYELCTYCNILDIYLS